MKPLVIFIKKLHEFTGLRMYLNVTGMILIGFFEGIGVYMIIPLLGFIGLIDVASSQQIPLFTAVNFHFLPQGWALPLVLMLYVCLIAAVSWMQRNMAIMNTQIQQGFIRRLRTDTYQTLLEAGWQYFVSRRKSDFQHVLTAELARVSQGTMIFLQLLSSTIFTFIQVLFAFLLSPILTLTVLGCGFVIALFAKRFVKHAKTLGDRTTVLSQDYFAGITDQLNGMKEIKSNMLEAVYYNWFDRLNANMERNQVNFVKLRSNTQFLYRTAAAGLIAIFVYMAFAWIQVRSEHLLLLVLIFARVWPRFTSIQSNIEQLVSMFPAFRELLKLQRESAEARELYVQEGSLHTTSPMSIEQGIECRNVSFRYDPSDRDYVLHNIHLRIPACAMTAIVGHSGSGKSTLIDLIMGLVQPEKGSILIDGRQLDSCILASYRAAISYVSQEPFLFHASIRDNLMLGVKHVTEEEMWRALQMSAADEFVSRMPQGLDTIVGDRGVRLSGGERQRIVLARAILRKPSILVLDEATSSLDIDHERKIQQALENLKGKMTLIVIAHRLSTIRGADHVVVLEQGKIVEQGDFSQLSNRSQGHFSKIWNTHTKEIL